MQIARKSRILSNSKVSNYQLEELPLKKLTGYHRDTKKDHENCWEHSPGHHRDIVTSMCLW